MTPPQVTDEVVRDCANAGISRVWMHRGQGAGAVSQAAVDFCGANAIQVVAGYCPYLFLPETGFLCRMHGWVTKIFGSYPA